MRERHRQRDRERERERETQTDREGGWVECDIIRHSITSITADRVIAFLDERYILKPRLLPQST